MIGIQLGSESPYLLGQKHLTSAEASEPLYVARRDFATGRREMTAARYLNQRINRSVNAEDTVLVARVQAGMASASYEAGPLGEGEVCLRSFARKLRAAIPEARLPRPPAPGWSGHAAVPIG